MAAIENNLDNSFGIIIDGEELLEPALVREVEVESNNNDRTTSDMCGSTRRESFGTGGLLYTVTGIITFENREGNLSVREILRLSEGDTVRVVSDFPNDGRITVRNVVVTQTEDLNGLEVPTRTDGSEKAATFQLQLGEKDENE